MVKVRFNTIKFEHFYNLYCKLIKNPKVALTAIETIIDCLV